MLSAIHIPYLRLRQGAWYMIVLLVVLGFSLPVRLVPAAGVAVHLPFDRHSIHAEDGEGSMPMIAEGHARHQQFSPRVKVKVPGFFKGSAATYTGYVLSQGISYLYTSSFLRSALLRPDYYLFLFRYTPF